MRKKEFSVVANLSRTDVTWADTYCKAMKRCGVQVSGAVSRNGAEGRLFIGDRLDGVVGNAAGKTMYFLAAVEGTKQEQDNVAHMRWTTTVSPQERERAVRLLGADPARVSVEGFPLPIERLQALSRFIPRQDARSVCFLGRMMPDKGQNLELELAAGLVSAGFSVLHMSNGHVGGADELRRRGVRVVEGVSGVRYHTLLAGCRGAVNTSPRESLFVSGMEAAALGVMVLAPDVPESGIRAWNRPECLYPADDAQIALEHILTLLASPLPHVADVRRYDEKRYARGIRNRFRHMGRQ